MAITHTHYCKYCDSTIACTDEQCGEFNSIDRQSKSGSMRSIRFHECAEREKHSKFIKRMLGGPVACKYGCKSLPCMHDKWADLKRLPYQEYQYDFVRPQQVTTINGKQLVLCEANAYSMQQHELTRKLAKLEAENARLKEQRK